MDKLERLQKANDLIQAIASCGRKIFNYQDRVARLELDSTGRVWFRDDYSDRLIYTHYKGAWRHFSHGGTMKSLIEALRDFVVHSKKLNPRIFGPWPEWVCNGDLWAYGSDMQTVRDTAAQLGVVSS